MPAEEEPEREVVLAPRHRLLQLGHAVKEDREQRQGPERVDAARRPPRVEQPVELGVMGRAPPVRLPLVEEVAVQVDVVLVDAADPGEAERVEHVQQHECDAPRAARHESGRSSRASCTAAPK